MKKNTKFAIVQKLPENALQLIKDMRTFIFLLLLVFAIALVVPLTLAVVRVLLIACVVLSLYFYVKRNAIYIP